MGCADDDDAKFACFIKYFGKILNVYATESEAGVRQETEDDLFLYTYRHILAARGFNFFFFLIKHEFMCESKHVAMPLR